MSNQHQLLIARPAAIDNKANFPTIPGQIGHITWINEDTYEDFGGRLSPNGNNDIVRHHQFYCPNRFDDWKRVSGGNLVHIRTGFQVLLGRGDKPNFNRRENFSEPALAWVSTLNIDTEPGTSVSAAPTAPSAAKTSACYWPTSTKKAPTSWARRPSPTAPRAM